MVGIVVFLYCYYVFDFGFFWSLFWAMILGGAFS